MKLRVFQDVLINGQWTGTGVGDFDQATADHLIKIGAAEPYEIKIIDPVVHLKKKGKPFYVSQPGLASQKTKSTRRGRKPTKPSQ